MEFDVFKKQLLHSIREVYPNMNVQLKEVNKNNSTLHTGLVFSEADHKIAPCIYIDNYFDNYKKGMSIEQIQEEIIRNYMKEERQEFIVQEKIVTDLNNFEKVKSRLSYKLVNYNANQSFLEDKPFTRFLDLAVVYIVVVQQTTEGQGCITISNKFLEMWKVNQEELHVSALYNAQMMLPFVITPMETIIHNLISCENNKSNNGKSSGMFVMSNSTGINGASVLLYNNILRNFVENLSDPPHNLYILPSSVHELILIPTINIMDENNLLSMVRDINRIEVLPEEVLSNNIYYFSHVNDVISIIGEESINEE